MRWVWRAESGASILEYAVVVVLAASIAAALIASGLPSAVTPAVTGAVCELYDAGHCDDKKGGGPDGSASDPGGSGADDPTDAASPSGDDPTTDPAADPVADPAADKKLKDAQKKYNKLKKEQNKAEADAEGFDKKLLKILEDMIGITDAKDCFTKGDIIACAKTAAGSLGVIKAARAITKVPKAISAFNKMRKASKVLDKANDRLNKQKKKLDALKKKAKQDKTKRKPGCTRAGGKKNSFLPGTPVLMADGTRVPIEDVSVGEDVLAFDPRTGEEGPRPVTDLIEGSGKKTLVTIDVTDEDGSASSLTATDEHPFWSPDRAEWVDADDLRLGDRLRTAEGRWAEVRSTDTRTTADREVHNLTTADLHTYYVGASGQELLVHNDERCPEIVLDKFDKYEQARNKALKLLGEVDPATRKPLYGRLKTATSTYGKKTGFTTRVNGVYKEFRMDYDPEKGPHINIMVGKGKSAKKYAVPWKGSEEDLAKLLKGNT